MSLPRFDTYDTMKLDTLLHLLGAFAETQPTVRELWIERLKTLRERRLPDREIADILNTTPGNVRTHAYQLGLPSKYQRRLNHVPRGTTHEPSRQTR